MERGGTRAVPVNRDAARRGGVKDTVSLDLGFRDVEATSQGVSLAGKALALRGVTRNECDGRTGLAVNIPEMLDDIVWCKRHASTRS